MGTTKESRDGFPHLQSVMNMKKKSVPRGTLEYLSSDGVLVARWKDSNVVTILSTDIGVEPLGEIDRYDKEVKGEIPVTSSSVIAKYNSQMGGIDKSNMLRHLYKTPFKANTYYILHEAFLHTSLT